MNFILLISLIFVSPSFAWDSEEMEIFDVVEEVNQNFYELMQISQDVSMADVRKAYRTLSKKLHPDKNDAPDAEIRFRQLVSVYEILRDEGKRARYNRVLVEGLPDWRSPIYYYRRARKLSLLESSIIITIVISITQYLMAWGAYLDRRRTMEELLCKKYRIKERKRLKNEDLENRVLMEEELNQLPRPRCWNIFPIQMVQFTLFLVTNGPSMVSEFLNNLQEERRRKEDEKLREELELKRMKEEEERKKEKKAQMKQRKRVSNLPDYTGQETAAPYSKAKVKESKSYEPEIVGGPWTHDDFSDLSRLMGKYPGGTFERWEKIALAMNRTVFEVTTMSNRVKANLNLRSAEEEQELSKAKVKVKTKGTESGENIEEHLGADELWSVVQQRALEKALKQFPKGTDQRWDKIARSVPEKSKEECIMRFKFLAERIKKKKESEEETAEPVCDPSLVNETSDPSSTDGDPSCNGSLTISDNCVTSSDS